MADVPTNRGFARLRLTPSSANAPSRVQADSFGTKETDSVTSGRPAAPRPALSSSPRQGREVFTTEKLDGISMARALNSLQTKIAESTAQARSNPFAEGRLFQGVVLTGTLRVGGTAAAPPSTGLPQGLMYFDTDQGAPFWLSGSNWVDYQGAVSFGATTGPLNTVRINHGFGSPAEGVIITNVKNAIIETLPSLVLSGDASDNERAQVSFSYSPTGLFPRADFYLYR